MVDVLALAKVQVNQWKSERVQAQKEQEACMQLEEMKFGEKAEEPVRSKSIVKGFINVTEKIARDEMSRMIGEKVIGKVFSDNLAEFNEN